MVRRLKYSRSTGLASFMSEKIAVSTERLSGIDAIVPVPIHWRRRNSRGFNQSEELAPNGINLLERIRATRPQVGLNREQRARNLAGAFRALPGAEGKTILLIDDVVTSGQTARECASALLAVGAIEVGILAFCGESGWQS
jgi:ComF family protein